MVLRTPDSHVLDGSTIALLTCTRWYYGRTTHMYPMVLRSHYSHASDGTTVALLTCTRWYYGRTTHMYPMVLRSHYSHVLDGSAECVCDQTVLDALLAEAEVSQLHVTGGVQQDILRLQVSANTYRERTSV